VKKKAALLTSARRYVSVGGKNQEGCKGKAARQRCPKKKKQKKEKKKKKSDRSLIDRD